MTTVTTESTPKKQKRVIDWDLWLRVFRHSANVSLACKAVNIDRTTPYQHRKRNKTFAAQWDEAENTAVDRLENMAWERAAISDTLLIFLLKAHRPAMYSDRLRISYEQVIEDTKRLAKEHGLDEGEAVAAAKQIMGLSK